MIMTRMMKLMKMMNCRKSKKIKLSFIYWFRNWCIFNDYNFNCCCKKLKFNKNNINIFFEKYILVLLKLKSNLIILMKTYNQINENYYRYSNYKIIEPMTAKLADKHQDKLAIRTTNRQMLGKSRRN